MKSSILLHQIQEVNTVDMVWIEKKAKKTPHPVLSLRPVRGFEELCKGQQSSRGEGTAQVCRTLWQWLNPRAGFLDTVSSWLLLLLIMALKPLQLFIAHLLDISLHSFGSTVLLEIYSVVYSVLPRERRGTKPLPPGIWVIKLSKVRLRSWVLDTFVGLSVRWNIINTILFMILQLNSITRVEWTSWYYCISR